MATAMTAAGCQGASAVDQARKPAEAVEVRPVETTRPERREFVDRVVTQGSTRARSEATLGPRVPGVLAAIHFDEGDTVAIGDVLFETDSDQLATGVKAREQAVRLAKVGIREARARVAQAAISVEQATRETRRYQGLADAAAIPREQFEKVETGKKQAAASLKHTKVLVQVARAQAAQAEVALELARSQLADALIVAPIAGTVVRRTKEPGERANPGEQVLVIADIDVLEAVAHLPAHRFTRVEVGKTTMDVTIDGEKLGAFTVTHKSPVVDVTTRTFEVRAEIPNADGKLAPGLMVEASIDLGKRSELAVPARAVVVKSGASLVFVVDSGKARSVFVKTGATSDGWTAIETGLSADAVVVSSGQNLLRDGLPVSEVGQ